MARLGRSFPAKAIIGRPRASTFAGAGSLAMSLTLSSSGGSIIPPFAARPRVYCQAVNRAGNFHHAHRRCSCQTWQPQRRMPPSTL
jgi:hypothetical protein